MTITAKELRELEARATAAPWVSDLESCVVDGMGAWRILSPPNLRAEGEIIVAGVVDIDQQVWPECGCSEANTELIVALRNSALHIADRLEREERLAGLVRQADLYVTAHIIGLESDIEDSQDTPDEEEDLSEAIDGVREAKAWREAAREALKRDVTP